jgi:hypothetical protein
VVRAQHYQSLKGRGIGKGEENRHVGQDARMFKIVKEESRHVVLNAHRAKDDYELFGGFAVFKGEYLRLAYNLRGKAVVRQTVA